MSGGTSPSPAALQLARRLLAREPAAGRKGEPKSVGAALQRMCRRVSENLRDTMGEDGSNALLARALARAESEHPALKNAYRRHNGGIVLDGVAASVEAHGAAAVTAAIEAVLAALIDILGRLIGEDMAIRLVGYDAPRLRRGDGVKTP